MNDPLGDKIKKDGKPYTKYDAAMEAITEFTTFRQGDAFGFTIFTSGVMHWVPLTTDLSAIRLATPFVAPGHVSAQDGGTARRSATRSRNARKCSKSGTTATAC